MFDKELFITIFTDASFCPHTRAMGWAVWIKYGDNQTVKWQGGHEGDGNQHSNHAERHGLKKALWMCKELQKRNRMVLKDKIVVIQCDCQHELNNLDTSVLTKLGVTYVKKKWVKAHTGKDDKRSSVNDWCDRMAYEEMSKVRAELRRIKKNRKTNNRKKTI